MKLYKFTLVQNDQFDFAAEISVPTGVFGATAFTIGALPDRTRETVQIAIVDHLTSKNCSNFVVGEDNVTFITSGETPPVHAFIADTIEELTIDGYDGGNAVTVLGQSYPERYVWGGAGLLLGTFLSR
jgi:hypothetical protein